MSPDRKTRHIWMPDGRALCDRRALVPGHIEDMEDDEFEAHVQEQSNAPACGSCLLLAGRIRHIAIAVLHETERRIHPKRPSEAWGQLRGTRWERAVDLDTFLEDDELDDKIVYEAIELAADPAVGRKLAEERAIDWDKARQWRAEQRENPEEE